MSDPLNGDDNMGRGQQLTTAGSQQVEDATILQGESQAPSQVESTNMVSTPGLLAAPSPDDSASAILQKQEQAENDEAAGDDLQPQLVVHDSQDVPDLPEELVRILLEFMEPGDILSASKTCHLWRNLGERDVLWKLKCNEAGLASILTPANRRALERKNENSSFKYSAWKESFLKPHKIAKKFQEGVAHMTTIEISYDVSQIEICNEKIVTKSGRNLYIFCAMSGERLHTLVGHTVHVREFQMDYEIIVSASEDKSVKVWDVDTGSCLHTLLGHTGLVDCLKMKGNVTVSGSWDRTLRVWDVKEGRCLSTLSRHTDWVQHVQFDGNVVVSGSYDRKIKIWDPVTGECRHTMIHGNYIDSLKFNGVDVVAGNDDSIKVWDINGVCRHTLVANYSWGGVMELKGDTLICRGERSTANIWSMSTGAHLQTLAGASRWITGIQLIRKLVVTCSRDGTVKLWDITTGEFIKNLLVLESGEEVEKMKIEDAKIVCAVRSKNGGSKLLVLNFDSNNEN